MAGELKGRWAVVLGSSSGFGEAISRKLAKEGMNIFGVHLDRKSTLPHAEEVATAIRSEGVKAAFYNVNAADATKRAEMIAEIAKLTEGKGVHCLVHSLAFGTLRPFMRQEGQDSVSKEQLEMTLDVMANSLVYWTQDLFNAKLLANPSHIYAMTSSGGQRVWPTYGAVSAAKAALESHCRQLALELAPHGVSVNAIRAGVTDTPALRKIPGHTEMIEMAKARNPFKRLTTPEDVASAIALFVQNGSQWMTGNVLGIDGGEEIVG